MSVNVRVVLENFPRKLKPSLPSDGKSLFELRDELDRAAKAAKVPSLWSFSHDFEEELKWAAEALGNPDTDTMTPEEEEKYSKSQWEMLRKTGKWYEPEEGLKSVNAILDRLTFYPTLGGGLITKIGPELVAIKRILEQAKEKGLRFRLRVS